MWYVSISSLFDAFYCDEAAETSSGATGSYFVTVSGGFWGFCVKLFILISTFDTSSTLPSAAVTRRQTLPPSLLLLSELIKSGFAVSLPFLFTPKQSRETKREGRGGGAEAHGSTSRGFPSSSKRKLFIAIPAVCVWKFNVPMKSVFTCKCGRSVCVVGLFAPLSVSSKSYMNKSTRSTWLPPLLLYK